MASTQSLLNFWSSLISEKGVSPHVESIMKIKEDEERAISLISRVAFLWFMGLKYEKDELKNILENINHLLKENSSSSCTGCSSVKLLIKNNLYKTSEEVNICSTSSSKSCIEERENLPETSKEKERQEHTQNSSEARRVLASETQYFSQEKITLPKFKELVVPETNVEENDYGNTDFFECLTEWEHKDSSPVLGKQIKSNNLPSSNVSRTLFPANPSTPEILSPDSIHSSPSLLDFEPLKPNVFQETEQKGSKLSSKWLRSKLSNVDPDSASLPGSSESDCVAISPPHDDVNAKNLLPANLNSKGPLEVPKVLTPNAIKTLSSLRKSKLNLEVSLDTNSVCKAKNYKQTKITKDGFFKKTEIDKLTGGRINREQDKLTEVIGESLSIKQIEKIMQKKQEDLIKESPPKLKKVAKADSFSPDGAVRRSPRRQRTNENKQPQAQTSGSNRHHLTEEEILSHMDKESKVAQCQEASKSPAKKRKFGFNDSFDIWPSKTKTVAADFAFKGDVVRKKTDRKRLEGWDCLECKDYYEAKGCTEAEKKEAKNKCSRHRSKHSAVTNTPEGFWKVGWS